MMNYTWDFSQSEMAKYFWIIGIINKMNYTAVAKLL